MDKEKYLNLIKKYNVIKGSFYTEYPPIGLWIGGFSDEEYRRALNEIPQDRKLGFYVHNVFCPEKCLYCQCHSLITKNRERVTENVDYLCKEIDMLSNLFGGNVPDIRKIHYGGGSPTYLDEQQFDVLHRKIGEIINTNNLEEVALEVDPRTVTLEKMIYYHEKGVNRISFGIQDFDPEVQKAVNRIQPIEMVEKLMTPNIRKHFGVNFDIIYGMPRQTRESFSRTIKDVIRLSPDRLNICLLGWRPDIFPFQRAIKESELPGLEEGALMNLEAIQTLLDAGYERIGLDHFSKPDDNYFLAKKQGKLHRNSQGYNPGDCIDLIGIGPSGTSRILNYYFQKEYDLKKYYSSIDRKKFPVFRGYKLTKNEELRREIMEDITCYEIVDFSKFEKKYGINFGDYFKNELNSFDELIQDEIVEVSDKSVNVTPMGKFFLRHVCSKFDELLRRGQKYKHSKEHIKI